MVGQEKEDRRERGSGTVVNQEGNLPSRGPGPSWRGKGGSKGGSPFEKKLGCQGRRQGPANRPRKSTSRRPWAADRDGGGVGTGVEKKPRKGRSVGRDKNPI